MPGIEDRLVQVFRNLIDNAVSFSPPGGAIRIAARRGAGFAVVTVEDDGPGIPPGKLEAIFDRFYSERPAGEKFGTHSGSGLSISKQIVETHRGTLRAENRIGAQGRVLRRALHRPAAGVDSQVSCCRAISNPGDVINDSGNQGVFPY